MLRETTIRGEFTTSSGERIETEYDAVYEVTGPHVDEDGNVVVSSASLVSVGPVRHRTPAARRRWLGRLLHC